MAEKQYKYTAKIKQPQTVADVKIDPEGGDLSEREYKTLKKDAYGASLLEKGLLAVEEVPVSEPVHSGKAGDKGKDKANIGGEVVPEFETKDTPKDRPEDHAGWKPE
jgi:hypothetical protein